MRITKTYVTIVAFIGALVQFWAFTMFWIALMLNIAPSWFRSIFALCALLSALFGDDTMFGVNVWLVFIFAAFYSSTLTIADERVW